MDHPALPSGFPGRPEDRPGYISRQASHVTCGIVHSGDSYWFTGQPYSMHDMDSWHPDLLQVMGRRADEGLSLYSSILEAHFKMGREDLDQELMANRRYLRRLMDTHVEPNIKHEGPDDHWIWQKPLTRKHPVLNFGGIHDVLVVRLTWVAQKPILFLPASKNPRKIENLCPDADPELPRCVNALHYYVAQERMDLAPNPRTRRGLPDGRTSKSQRWEVRGQTVVCQRVGHPLSLSIQDKYRRLGEEGLRKYEHCPGCWGERMDQSGYLGRQRRGTGALAQDTAHLREIEEQAWLAMLSAEQERGQIVPPTEEPVRVWDETNSPI